MLQYSRLLITSFQFFTVGSENATGKGKSGDWATADWDGLGPPEYKRAFGEFDVYLPVSVIGTCLISQPLASMIDLVHKSILRPSPSLVSAHHQEVIIPTFVNWKVYFTKAAILRENGAVSIYKGLFHLFSSRKSVLAISRWPSHSSAVNVKVILWAHLD